MATTRSQPAAAFENPLDTFLGYQLRRASAAVLAELSRTLADLKLRPAEASILQLIAANPNITQSDIGRILGIQRANIAPLTAMLIDRGFIERIRADGRSHALRLTNLGADIAAHVHACMTAHEDRLLPHLSAQERAALVALLQKVWAF